MQSIINSFLRQLECPVCLKCGSFQVQCNYFCRRCAQQFLSPRFEIISQHVKNEILVHSFLNWFPQESDSISELVYLLKLQSSKQAWAWFVSRLQAVICELVNPMEHVVLVPIPGSKKSFHTAHFSLAIQELTGCSRASGLKMKPNHSAQKKKNKLERETIRFEICEEFTIAIAPPAHVILIDDIVTTGSTVWAAAEAIKRNLAAQDIGTIKITALTLFRRYKNE